MSQLIPELVSRWRRFHIKHEPRSQHLYRYIADLDSHVGNVLGLTRDKEEYLLYLLDAYFRRWQMRNKERYEWFQDVLGKGKY